MYVQSWVQWNWLQINDFTISVAIKAIWGAELPKEYLKGNVWKLFSYRLQKEAMKTYGFASGDTEEKSMTKNLLKVQVFFTSLNVQAVTEDPKYEVRLFDVL